MDQKELSIEGFVDKLLEEKGMTGLDDEVLAQLKRDLVDRVENRINAVILEKMPSDKLEGFEKVLDSGDESQVQAYTQEAIPDLDQVIATELVKFRAIYLG